MAKHRRQKPKKPHSAPSPGRHRLKVFKTPIGFHDAYVAAPSRKAALDAWGAGTDLFSAGIAELAGTDGEGAKAALARPGEVVRVKRGGAQEVPSPQPSPASGRGRKRRKPKPKPSRAAVDKAETALAALEGKQEAERAQLAAEEERLARRRRALEDRQAKAREKAEAGVQAAEGRYREAMRAWDG